MSRKNRPTESGQILVILALALIALLAFTALAVDISMVFSDRRYDQSVADTAALAGAEKVAEIMRTRVPKVDITNFDCVDEKWSNEDSWVAPKWLKDPSQVPPMDQVPNVFAAAITRAATNNVTLAELADTSPDHGVALRCNNSTKEIEVKVLVSGITRSSFAHLIFNGPLRNTVTAISKIGVGQPFSYGNSILALNDICHGKIGGMDFNGTVNIYTYNGGGIFSNQCMAAPGSSATVRVCDGDPGEPCNCDEMAGAIGYISNTKPINGDICPAMVQADRPVPRQTLDFNGCDVYNGDPGQTLNIKGDTTISPGKYSKISASGSGINLKLEPGLYCIADSFDVTGGTIESLGGSGAEKQCMPEDTNCGVTIFMLNNGKNNQTLTLIGNSGVHLSAAVSEKNLLGIAAPKPKVGLLIATQDYPSTDRYTGEIHLGGDSGGLYLGMIFNPYGTLKVSGNPTAQTPPSFGFTSMIADSITFSGNVTVEARYDAALDLYGNTVISLMK